MERRIFGPKRESVTGGRRNNEEHQDAYKVFIGKYERKRLYERLRHR
jgi:hypothetical protein